MHKPCLKCGDKKDPRDFNPKKTLYCLVCEPHEPRKSRAAASLVTVDFDREYQKLLTVLHRDIEKLLLSSHEAALSRDESNTLIAYLKVVAELKAMKLLEETETEIQENQNESLQSSTPSH